MYSKLLREPKIHQQYQSFGASKFSNGIKEEQSSQPRNIIETIESRDYSDGSYVGISRSNGEIFHNLDSTLVRKLVNKGVIGTSQFSTYHLFFCTKRRAGLCYFRMIEKREQYSGTTVYSILESHSAECIHEETRSRKGEISDCEFFTKESMGIVSDRGNRGGMIFLHNGKVHRNKGKSSNEYRRFFCKEKGCSHRIIERKNDGMVCIRGFHECLNDRNSKKTTVKFYPVSQLCVTPTSGHLKQGKPAKNMISNGCLFLSNRRNVVLGGRKFEENTLANEYICQIKNQFKRNRNRDRSDYHCNAIIKERISDGSVILQGHHDPKCIENSKKFFSPEIHGIETNDVGQNIRVRGLLFSPLGTRSIKFGKEEVSVMEYICSCKSSYSHLNCNAVIFKNLENETYFLSGKHDESCLTQKFPPSLPSLLPNLRIIAPPEPPSFRLPPPPNFRMNPIIPPPPPPHQTQTSQKASGRKTRNSQKRTLIDPKVISDDQNKRKRRTNPPFEFSQVQSYNEPSGFSSNMIPELRILAVYPGIVQSSGSTINILLRCPPNLSHLIQSNLFTVYFSENQLSGSNRELRTEVIPRTSFYFPAIQFSSQIGNEWGIGQASCRIVMTLPFFFGLQGLLNLSIDLQNNIHLEMKNALVVSSNIDRRQNELEYSNNNENTNRDDDGGRSRKRKRGKKRKIVDLLIPENEKGGQVVVKNGGNVQGGVSLGNSRICSFFTDNNPALKNPKVSYAEIFLLLQEGEKDNMEFEVFFNDQKATIFGGFDHRYGVRLTRFCKMNKSKYDELCPAANFVLTVDVPEFTISSPISIDLLVVIGKKKNLVLKNVFKIDNWNEEVATSETDPFLISLNQQNVELNETLLANVTDHDVSSDQLEDMFHQIDELPPPKKMISKYNEMMFHGSGFHRVESLDELDQLGEF